jgi:transcriptional regulator GlxA family with amidase domain
MNANDIPPTTRSIRAVRVPAPVVDGETKTQRMGFFLVPHFSMMALSSVTEPLRAANRVSGKALYSWHLISADGEPVSSSCCPTSRSRRRRN